jgi:hypothetical protein
LLKAPDHLGALTNLLAVMPDATIAVCLRDPAATVPSLDSLLMTVHAVTTRELNPHRMGDVNLAALVADGRRYMAARDVHKARMVELPYAAIRADAPGAAAQVFDRAGLDFDAACERRFRDFAAANPQHGHGVHRYSPEDFGETAVSIGQRFGAFAELSATQGSAA